MHCHEPTKTYVQRRTQQGLSKLDIMRCLKRYIAGCLNAPKGSRSYLGCQVDVPGVEAADDGLDP